eukprot:GHUV01008816.1.p1 GENE.GHUV01008816.1~~GHUV01008816.1.p1  ORF type:complete len:312 (+),score=60.61 GHUV01008816.1:343-1278(+)
MNGYLGSDIGVAMLCLETCFEDSPSYADAMSMDHRNDQGLLSELSCCSCTHVERLGFGDPSYTSGDDDGDDLKHQQDQQLQEYCSHYLSTTQAKTGLTQSQRATLVDSMIALTEQLGLTNDTLFLGVAVLDRYLSVAPVSIALLQPISVACLWIASKYEELCSLTAAVFAPYMLSPDGQSLGNESHAVQLLVKLEIGVLQALEYRLASILTTKSFKHRIIQRLWSDEAAVAKLPHHKHQQLYSLTSYLTEVSLLEYQLLRWPPSMLAAAAYAVAQILLGLHLVRLMSSLAALGCASCCCGLLQCCTCARLL